MKSQETHRSGPLKQDNKRHKFGRHRSNRAINAGTKGKTQDDVKGLTKRGKELTKRHERRNQMKQMRQNRRDETLLAKRGLGGADSLPPILVAVLDLNSDHTVAETTDKFLDLVRNCDENCVFNDNTNERNFYISFPKLKTRFEFIFIDNEDLYSALDSAKVADILLILHSVSTTTTGADDQSLLDAIYSHCLPTTVHIINGLLGLSIKKRNEMKKLVQKLIDKKFANEKVRSVDTSADVLQLMHFMSNCKRKQNSFRSKRTQVLAEKVEFEPNREEEGLGLGTLKVWGYVRNKPLDVNSLVHIPGFGDYQLSAIEVFNDPNPLLSSNSRIDNKSNNSMNFENNLNLKFVLRADPTKQQTLDSENIADPMDGEQTWPTDEELAAAEDQQKVVKKVPKGTSEYQAVWIVDNDNEEDSEGEGTDSSGEEEEEENDLMESIEEESDDENDVKEEEEMDEMETMSVSGQSVNDGNYDQKMDLTEEQSAHQKFKEQRQYELFPDEVDTPIDQLAKVRFARYRGLKSFRTSSWDPNENLPKDYSRIFQFQNFRRTHKRVINDAEQSSGAQSGWYVCAHVTQVPKEAFDCFANNRRSLLLYGLLEHEHRMSTMNLVIKRCAQFAEPIKSKETLVFHVGCRRFRAAPVFSAHTNGDKHKVERFLRSDVAVVATLYAPITFPSASVLVYKEFEDGSAPRLVATGSLLSCDPNRIIVKRIVLSGHPFKINRKHAVVRYMFFNREDILWFRPIELRTKYGRKGHIREPLGTRGHMKCVFDRQLNSQDSVLMNLYKRVFPKWTFDHTLGSTPVSVKTESTNEDMDSTSK